jgi:UDP-glucose 4-epimerase
MAEMRRVLVTGATGKVGQNFIASLLANPKFAEFKVRALCHHRSLPETERLEVIRGSIEHREVAGAAVADVSHVVHLATSKETPDSVMDVAIKGMFWLLEACRSKATPERSGTRVERRGSSGATRQWASTSRRIVGWTSNAASLTSDTAKR